VEKSEKTSFFSIGFKLAKTTLGKWQNGKGGRNDFKPRKQVWPKWQNGRMAEGVKMISNFENKFGQNGRMAEWQRE